MSQEWLSLNLQQNCNQRNETDLSKEINLSEKYEKTLI
jgi:hypothetical protein